MMQNKRKKYEDLIYYMSKLCKRNIKIAYEYKNTETHKM